MEINESKIYPKVNSNQVEYTNNPSFNKKRLKAIQQGKQSTNVNKPL